MTDSTTIHVPHLGGINVAYRMPSYDPQKPTIVLLPPFTVSIDIFRPQFEDDALTDIANLLAIDPLGHGGTRTTKEESWTLSDSATMTFQALDKLGVDKVFLFGVAQGGFMSVLATLIQPDRVLGTILLGATLDNESAWDAPAFLTPIIESLTSREATPDFIIEPEFCEVIFDTGLGELCTDKELEFWKARFRECFSGDEGRRRLRMVCMNIRDREKLYNRVHEVRCPVLWLHGSEDVTISVEQPQYDIKMFTNSSDSKLEVLDGGKHFLNRSHRKEVDAADLLESRNKDQGAVRID
ncbi:Alpha beta hydrolase [Aspergillus sclerotialis]|uniref:Alpha beta hydrolase n=1 Tax=Aspergillus sclerotialis TaxID=2070753 RepID=A0A3A2ZY91_9EURO|nr:Alpha beta hydrolase [Aspergillus sclerotialis]